MNSLSIIAGSPESKEFLRATLAGLFDSNFVEFDDLGRSTPGLCTVVDINLDNVRTVPYLKKWLDTKPAGAKVVFVTDKASRAQADRAFAIGASDIVHRPIQSADLIAKLLGDVAQLSDSPHSKEMRASPAAAAAVGGLRKVFSAAVSGERLEVAAVNSAGGVLIDELEKTGLAAWIKLIRTHDSQTYQHSLMVTGLLARFGQQLQVSRSDRLRLSVAGMLHDIGKARVPLAILEKRGPLTQEESAVLRQHPQFGFDALKDTQDIAPELLEVVLHHHEYLDGTGYPHGLKSNEIPDLVRLVTIADVFGAMIAWGSHRPAMSCQAAYKALIGMGPKLDQQLVREFLAVAKSGQQQ
jgi:HD-GYP domain-containing protein (c-di-GMP phosphodiesterase class II)